MGLAKARPIFYGGYIMSKYLVIDTETTGLNPSKHGIITLSALICDDEKIIKEWHGVNNNWRECDIDVGALKVNNFKFGESVYFGLRDTKQVSCDQQTMLQHFADFCLYNAGSCEYLLGMNVQFDLSFIKKAFEKQNINIDGLFPRRQIDPLHFATGLIDIGILSKTKYLNSKFLYDLYEIESNGIHASDVDVRLTFHLWQKMKLHFKK